MNGADSYYGRPVVKPHVWHWYIPAYFWIGGMAGAASVQCVAARACGNDGLARISQRAALLGALAAPVLLIADLGRPARFLNMLRVFKVTSPMSVGSWILSAFGSAIGAATLADVLGRRGAMRAAEFAAAALGAPLTVYTAVLISDTATPVWHEAYEVLPFVFVASGIGGAGAIGTLFASERERALPRRSLIVGGLALALGGAVMEQRLGPLLAEPYRKGPAGALRLGSGACALLGAALGATAGRSAARNRLAAVCVIAAGVLERFAVTEAGRVSALDPKYTVVPQRERLQARAVAAAVSAPRE